MKNYEKSKIRLLESFIRKIVDEVIYKIDSDKLVEFGQSFLSKTKERFRFTKERDLRFLYSSLDTIGDSQLAIVSFLNSKIENGKKLNTGERYLRLYGLLSAIYIQYKAILKLVEIVKVNNKNEIKKQFEKLDIIFLRNCTTAHPTDLDLSLIKTNTDIKITSYRIVRNSLNDIGDIEILDEKNNSKKYNIYNALEIFIKTIETYLYEIGVELISHTYKSSEEKKEKLKDNLGIIYNTNSKKQLSKNRMNYINVKVIQSY